ncbi:MAG: DNA-methyltransferase [Rhabdochlamydiaceae bacterium]
MGVIAQEDRIKYFPLSNGKQISLYRENCLIGLNEFPDSNFDVVVTSPPYNLGVRYSEYKDNIPRSEYLQWLRTVSLKVKQKMKDDGSFFLNIGSIPTNPWGPFQIANVLGQVFQLQNTIHWIKSIYIENESYGEKTSKAINVGHYKPINGTRFLNDSHEYIFHLTKTGNVPLDRLAIGVPYKDNGNITRWKNGSSGIRCRGNTWYVPYKTIRSREKERPHPATFPIEIAEMCVKLHGIKNDTIALDPFMGIGNTSLACAKLNVNCVGFEIDQNYFDTNWQLLEAQNNDTLSSFAESSTDSSKSSCESE